MPHFIAQRVAPGEVRPNRAASYAPWLVANVTLDRLPAGLATEIRSASPVELVDATALFATVRTGDDQIDLRVQVSDVGLGAEAASPIGHPSPIEEG